LIIIHDNDIPLADRWEAITMLEDKIETCQREQAEEKKAMLNARYDVEGETLRTNFWTHSSNGYQTRDTIHEFKMDSETDSATRFENRPRHMAQLARDYHNTVQGKDLPDEYSRLMATEIVLEKCDAHLSERQYREMDRELTGEDIREALKFSKNGKAPGLDGIPYEFFRILDIKFQQMKGTLQVTFDIMNFLARLYRHIEVNGITKDTNFNDGWLCPIYKKGDKALIQNYRPITLLNTDYKLMTKAYSLRLMDIAPSLVHLDQAGFMKGRKIENQFHQIRVLSIHGLNIGYGRYWIPPLESRGAESSTRLGH
jgi:hypothetical protein